MPVESINHLARPQIPHFHLIIHPADKRLIPIFTPFHSGHWTIPPVIKLRHWLFPLHAQIPYSCHAIIPSGQDQLPPA